MCRVLPAALAQKQTVGAELVSTDVLSCVKATTRIFDAFASPDNGIPASMTDDNPQTTAVVELWFLFAVIWGVGGSMSATGQPGCAHPIHFDASVFAYVRDVACSRATMRSSAIVS